MNTIVDLAKGPDHVIMFIVFLQFLIFIFALIAIYKLWMSVIEFLGQKSTPRAKILAGVLGGAEISSQVKSLKLKAIGTGLGGTVSILAVAVIAMYVLGNHVVT